MRTLAIGDIHGCLAAFDLLMARVEVRPDDRLIALGDYVDRGPDSRGVLDRVIKLYEAGQLIALRGNHDAMMVDALRDPARRSERGCTATSAAAPATSRSSTPSRRRAPRGSPGDAPTTMSALASARNAERRRRRAGGEPAATAVGGAAAGAVIALGILSPSFMPRADTCECKAKSSKIGQLVPHADTCECKAKTK